MTKFNLEEKSHKISFSKISRINQMKKTNQKKSDSQRIYVFQQRVKSLNFAAMISRLDIIFATTKLTQFLQNPDPDHLAAADRVIAYLNEIKNLAIEYSSRVAKILLCVSDATFADDELTRKSSNDFLFKLYEDLID